MLVLSNESKRYLKESLKSITGSRSLHKMFNDMSTVLREDAKEVDFSGFTNRCNWLLGKLVPDRNTILQYAQQDTFKEVFKDVEISEDDNTLKLTVGGNEVVGNTKILAITMIVYSYALLMNLNSLGEKTAQIGGLILQSYSESLAGELVKRSFLSAYSINGDVIKVVCGNLHAAHYLCNIVASLLGLLLIKKDFDKVTQSTCLLLVSSIKSMVKDMAGFIHAFIEKAGELLNMDLKFLAQDVYKQLKLATS